MEKISTKVKIVSVLMLISIGWMLFAYIHQLTYGLGVTGMNKPVFWGLYIVNFVFFIGVSAGGIAVASLCHLAGMEKYKPIGRITEVVAIISLVLAIVTIVLDLGRADRLLNVILYPQITSPLTWDVAVINIYLVLCLALLISDIVGFHKLTKIFAYISVPTFVLVHSVTAWIFGLMKSQPGWHTTILAPLFIISALVSGLGLIVLALIFSRTILGFNIEDDIIISLGKYLKFLLPLLFYFLFSEIITGLYAQVPEHLVIIKELLTGKFAKIFWLDIGVGIVLPFILIISPLGKAVFGVGIVSLMCFLGVFAERTNIILPSFYHTFLPYFAAYSPTWVEWSLIAGTYALGIFLFIIAFQIIPLRVRSK
ncbi:MAG: polysulfide reductase NrfD [Elusimicrobia bacterium]|nr:polysulfide reductase NrfD [Elusimicrobiota bacterium]